MITSRLLGMCIIQFLLVITLVSAVSTAYESASVSRLVGTTPEDIINQLDVEELNLNHASYYADTVNSRTNANKPKSDVLRSMFDNPLIKDALNGGWNYDNIELDEFESNELLVIEAEGEVAAEQVKSKQGETVFTPERARAWKDDFAEHYPLFIFDSNYGGLTVPKEDSFVYSLTRYSQMIAPTFVHSREFVKAMLCNLGDGKTLGNSFREARNRYYSFGDPSEEELLGVTLMSYHLYGNPLSAITTPFYDPEQMKEYCGDLLGEKEKQPFGNMGVQEIGEPNIIREVLEINYELDEEGDYEVINIEGGDNYYGPYELVKPYLIKTHELPLNAVITGITYNFENPEELGINLPQYQNQKLEARECYENTDDESLQVKQVYLENKQSLNILIDPLAVTDCGEGEFILYNTINYEISYISKSPFYFDELNYPAKITPATEFELNADISYVNDAPLNGEIELLADGISIYQEEINERLDRITIPIISSYKEGFTKYLLLYKENGQSIVQTEFEIETRTLDFWLEIPELVRGEAEVILKVINYQDSNVQLMVYDNLVFGNTKLTSGVNSYEAEPGLNQYRYHYGNLLQANQQYKLKYDLGYNNKKEVLNDLIITNHRPILELIKDITVREGDLVQISPLAIDMEGDGLTYTVSEPVGDDGLWQTAKGNAGVYLVTITASDDYVSTMMVVKVTVVANHLPFLEDIDNIITATGETVNLILFGTDEDEDALSYEVADDRFERVEDNWFRWQITEEDIGVYEVEYSVTDGRDRVSKRVTITVIEGECRIDVDCGEPQLRGEAYCGENYLDIFQQRVVPVCVNFRCEENNRAILLDTCEDLCIGTQCQEDLEVESILAFSPNSMISIDEGSSQEFSIELKEAENHDYSVRWVLDRAVVATGTSFIYRPNFNAQGRHEIFVYVSEGELEEQHKWVVTVNNREAPDSSLVISNLRVLFPLNPITGEATLFSFMIENRGEQIARNIEWVFDPWHEGLADDQFSDSITQSPRPIELEVGRRRIVTTEYVYDAAYEGEVLVEAVDGEGRRTQGKIDITVSQVSPDLEVSDLEVFFPPEPRAGEETFFKFIIRNVGRQAARNVQWTLDPLHEGLTENEFSDGAFRGNPFIIPAGERRIISVGYTYVQPYQGEVFVDVVENSGEVSSEINRDNNKMAIDANVR